MSESREEVREVPKKVSVKHAARDFDKEMGALGQLLGENWAAKLTDSFESSVYEYMVSRLCVAFEDFILRALVGVINNDTRRLSGGRLATKAGGVQFPRHMSDAACEFILTKGGYLNIRQRDGLIEMLRDFLPEDCYLLQIVNDPKYAYSLKLLWPMRDYAVHRSKYSKRAAIRATQAGKMPRAGDWLKTPLRGVELANWTPPRFSMGKPTRFFKIVVEISSLVQEVGNAAPF